MRVTTGSWRRCGTNASADPERISRQGAKERKRRSPISGEGANASRGRAEISPANSLLGVPWRLGARSSSSDSRASAARPESLVLGAGRLVFGRGLGDGRDAED